MSSSSQAVVSGHPIAAELLQQATKTGHVTVSSEMFGVDQHEHRIGGEADDPIAADASGSDVQRAALSHLNVGRDPMRLVQWNRQQVLDGQAASDCRGSNKPRRKTQHVVARRSNSTTVGKPGSADVAVGERHIGVYRIATAICHQMQAMRILRPTTQTCRGVVGQQLRDRHRQVAGRATLVDQAIRQTNGLSLPSGSLRYCRNYSGLHMEPSGRSLVNRERSARPDPRGSANRR